MVDYISRKAAIDAVDVGNLHHGIIDALQDIISEIPAADVVEVVRCRECRDWDGNRCTSIYGLFAAKPNDYCSRGVK